jgi:uncharacterized membrane-anchored protein YitT (DUF2179 family)
MPNNSKKIKNKKYLLISRFTFWLTVLFTIPLFIFDTYKLGSTLTNTLIFLLYIYISIGNYLLGYRLDNPPKWSSWVIPKQWIVEWRYLVYADPEDIKENQSKLFRFIGGGILLVIFLLATLSDKIF